MRILTVLILALFLSGCAGAARDQGAADAYAGADAIAQESKRQESIAIAQGYMQIGAAFGKLYEIAKGVGTNALASRGARTPKDLPEAQISADEILEDPAKYESNAESTHEDSLGTGFWAAVSGGGLLLLTIAQRLGLGGPIVGVVATVLENTKTKDQKRKERELASFGVKAIEIIEDLPEDLSATIKKQVSKAVTPDQEKAIRQVLEERSKA